MKKVKLIEVRSELGAGTRGASMGVDALQVACWDKGSDYFKRFNSVSVPDLNYTLFDKDLFPHAHRIDSILTVQKNIANTVEQTIAMDMFPLVLSGDHSNAHGTIAGIKAAYPDKTLGVIWIDAHADIHSPYTSPSGNVHGMPLAAALNIDNLERQINEPEPETIFFWNSLKKLGVDGPKLEPKHLVYMVVRDTEEPEDYLLNKYGIRNYSYAELNAKGVAEVAAEALEQLRECDIIYVSFDVDSLDSKFSKGTGTPVEIGLTVEQAKELNSLLLQDPRIVCYEMTEINPTLDTENTMAENAFDILEAATEAILHRESKSTAIH
ncbi:arginase [Pontibacter sp. BT310]|uniref:Arginase n=1 Tax=Pontibacter populi TaxID=890055 RepID=A0ABS6XCW1_9BACT|nr:MULTISPECIES: arginase [Pontibacter]MBJ6118857.1 arginase [Pontibacter sp. BT310]MBR0571285.1 arginase [Microvirga sp. STS03]MBW3365711.1 arginase [Pontibacter populi]